MTFNGIVRRFSTEGDRQFEEIGAFWDECARAAGGREALRGLGFCWTDGALQYAIGRKDNGALADGIKGRRVSIQLPDADWEYAEGTADSLDALYREIYRRGKLLYEIETFSADGSCRVEYIRGTESI